MSSKKEKLSKEIVANTNDLVKVIKKRAENKGVSSHYSRRIKELKAKIKKLSNEYKKLVLVIKD